MEAMTFGAFSHLKADAISELLEQAGEIVVRLKPKRGNARELHVIDGERFERLRELESRWLKEQQAERWRVENRDAIEALNEFVDRAGVFGAESRAF
jgi:hypothetical protein